MRREYHARSVRVDRFELPRWGRRLVPVFEVYEGDPLEDAPILAQLPMYFRLHHGRVDGQRAL